MRHVVVPIRRRAACWTYPHVDVSRTGRSHTSTCRVLAVPTRRRVACWPFPHVGVSHAGRSHTSTCRMLAVPTRRRVACLRRRVSGVHFVTNGLPYGHAQSSTDSLVNQTTPVRRPFCTLRNAPTDDVGRRKESGLVYETSRKMLLPLLVVTQFFLALVLWTTATDCALYRTASIGGTGGTGFDDFTVINSTSDYRPRNILLWQTCVGGVPCHFVSGLAGFEPSHAICNSSGCSLKWDRKRVVHDWQGNVGPTSEIILEHGDFVEMMYGYISLSGLYLLNGVGIVVRRRGAEGESEEIFAGYREGLYVEIIGPLVGFWYSAGTAFDQLGAYMDPSVWPERPSRLVIREMHGVYWGGTASDTYFNSVNASGRPYAMRLLNMTISYKDTSIVDIAATFKDDLGGIMHWSVGTNGAYTYQSTIASTGPGGIDTLGIAMQTFIERKHPYIRIYIYIYIIIYNMFRIIYGLVQSIDNSYSASPPFSFQHTVTNCPTDASTSTHIITHTHTTDYMATLPILLHVGHVRFVYIVTFVVLMPNRCEIPHCHGLACDLLMHVGDLCAQATKSS